MKINTFFRVCLVIITISILLTACSSENPAVNESWSLIDLVSKEERTYAVTEIVEVRNCETIERKTTECSAGTNNDLTVSLEGGIQLVGGVVSMNTSVANGLGIGRNSGETLTLDTPDKGSIYIYTIDKEYRLITGKMLVRSSAGREAEADYAFHASCSIRVVNVETSSCTTVHTPSSSLQSGEILIAHFANGPNAVTSQQEYSGLVTVTVSGIGQASGTQYSDAFYLFTDSYGNRITPVHPTLLYNWVLWINGQHAENLIPGQQVPAYQSTGEYTFQINAPGGYLTFGVGDVGTGDNTGSYTIRISSPPSNW